MDDLTLYKENEAITKLFFFQQMHYYRYSMGNTQEKSQISNGLNEWNHSKAIRFALTVIIGNPLLVKTDTVWNEKLIEFNDRS